MESVSTVKIIVCLCLLIQQQHLPAESHTSGEILNMQLHSLVHSTFTYTHVYTFTTRNFTLNDFSFREKVIFWLFFHWRRITVKLFKTIFLFMVVYSVLILAGFTRLFWSEYKHNWKTRGGGSGWPVFVGRLLCT